jgi:hypothetical protein
MVYAQDLSISQRIEKVYDNILKNEIVVKFISSIKVGWEKFKKWFNNLPGIKQYNASVYSGKNWKKTMNSMGNEYSSYLQKDSLGIKQIREGKKQWDNL